MEVFKCGAQGSMRRSRQTNSLVLISDPLKALQEDRWDSEKNILYYIGIGKIGDQKLKGTQNKTLYESKENDVEIYLFEFFEKGKYTFMGPVNLAADPYQEKQMDQKGHMRNVWIFPLQVKNNLIVSKKSKTTKNTSENANKTTSKNISKSKSTRKNANANTNASKSKIKGKKPEHLSNTKLKQLARNAVPQAAKKVVESEIYDKNPYVAEYVKRRAKGICQLCGKPAPFNTKEGQPYLETHHIQWLSQGGEDTINNTIALCPDCHSKMHVLNLEEDIKILKDRTVDKKINKAI
jgi:5-methylcytosine-specific restriction protein A